MARDDSRRHKAVRSIAVRGHDAALAARAFMANVEQRRGVSAQEDRR